MIMLKTTWNDVTERTVVNCFGKSRISVEAQKGAMNNHDDPFEEMMANAEDDNAVEKLEFDLK